MLLPVTHDELAMWVGTTRDAASRALGRLCATGTITCGRGNITVVDIAGLQAHARSLTH